MGVIKITENGKRIDVATFDCKLCGKQFIEKENVKEFITKTDRIFFLCLDCAEKIDD